jgi:hypothetical protein
MIEPHPSIANRWIDPERPEHGEFCARAGMTIEDVTLEWDAAFAAPTEDQIKAEAVANLRYERNAKLTETDWTQLADSPVDKARWAIYRQQLRDLPANTPDPAKPTWPKRPDDTDKQAAERELDRAARTARTNPLSPKNTIGDCHAIVLATIEASSRRIAP